MKNLAASYAVRAESARELIGAESFGCDGETIPCNIGVADVEAYDQLAIIMRQIRDGKETFGGALDNYRAMLDSDDAHEKAVAKIVVCWIEKERDTQ